MPSCFADRAARRARCGLTAAALLLLAGCTLADQLPEAGQGLEPCLPGYYRPLERIPEGNRCIIWQPVGDGAV